MIVQFETKCNNLIRPLSQLDNANDSISQQR